MSPAATPYGYMSGVRTFAVLGPTEVHDGDRPVVLGGPLPRRLLTALLAAAGRPVPDCQLSEAVWEGRPPAGAKAGLQVDTSRLRRALGDAGRSANQLLIRLTRPACRHARSPTSSVTRRCP